MIAILRISGQIGLKKDQAENLSRMKLRKKYTLRVFENPTEVDMGMIKAARNFVAYGEITKETYEKIIEARGKKDVNGELRKDFHMHPARGGIKTKFHYPQGVLGENKKMDELLRRML